MTMICVDCGKASSSETACDSCGGYVYSPEAMAPQDGRPRRDTDDELRALPTIMWGDLPFRAWSPMKGAEDGYLGRYLRYWARGGVAAAFAVFMGIDCGEPAPPEAASDTPRTRAQATEPVESPAEAALEVVPEVLPKVTPEVSREEASVESPEEPEEKPSEEPPEVKPSEEPPEASRGGR